MTRLNVLIAFFVSISLSAIAQDNLHGKWFMFSRNRIIQFIFSNDQLITNQLNWDLNTRERNKPDTQTIIYVTNANGNIYLYLKNIKDTTNKIRVNTFKITHPSQEMLIVLNAADSLFADTTSVRQYIMKDNDIKYGLTLYSENEMQKLRQQKKIAEMTVTDFKTYADKVIQFRTELDSLSNLPNAPNALLYYGYSTIRNIIGQLGYNPLLTNTEYDDFIKRFQNIPETKPIVDKLMQ